MVIDADEFIAVKGFGQKVNVSLLAPVETINELETDRFPEPPRPKRTQRRKRRILDPDHGKSEGDILDEMTGQDETV